MHTLKLETPILIQISVHGEKSHTLCKAFQKLQHSHGQLLPHVLITTETIFPLQAKFSLDFNKN